VDGNGGDAQITELLFETGLAPNNEVQLVGSLLLGPVDGEVGGNVGLEGLDGREGLDETGVGLGRGPVGGRAAKSV
jgi:hypothetical protein